MRKWTDEEIQFLKDFYPDNGGQWIANKLGRTKYSVIAKSNSLGLKIKPETKSKLEELKWSPETSRSKLDSYKLVSDFNIYSVYLLGLFWADGWIHNGKRKEIKLKIVSDDMVDIKPILEEIGGWSYIKTIPKAYNGHTGREQTTAVICNKHAVLHLIEHDYLNKSYISPHKILSIIPKELIHYWWRGYFDGDGCLHINKEMRPQVTLTGSIGQDWTFVNKLFNELCIPFHSYKKGNPKWGHSSCITTSGRYGKIFLDYIYQGYNPMGLSRKYARYLTLVDYLNNKSIA